MPKLCVALDLDLESAEKLVHDLKGTDVILKVGPPLLMEGGKEFIESLKKDGFEVFLDLKIHDIPNTVARSVRQAQIIGADYLTVHALGGRDMLEAARESAGNIKLIGVTVLTSHDESFLDYLNSKYKTIGELAKALALRLKEAGIHGVVCSAHEVREIKESTGLMTVVPGIRFEQDKGDQRRTATPQYAVSQGADILVVGREIINSENPKEKVHELLRIAGS